MPATINGTTGFGGNLTGNVTGNVAGNSDTATTLSTATGSAPAYACRAWVNFDGTRDTTGASSTANTNRLIRASGNVASVLRTGVGTYTINFTTAMSDANYAVNVTTSDPSGASVGMVGTTTASTAGVAACRINPTAYLDNSIITASIFR